MVIKKGEGILHIFLPFVLILLFSPSAGAQQANAPRGLWLLPRKDAGNSGRADVPGRMKTAPKEVWSIGGGGEVFSFCQSVRIAGKTRYFGLVRSGLRLVETNGRSVWENARLGATEILGVGDFQNRQGVEAVVALGQAGVALINVSDGAILWKWSDPSGAYLGSCKLWARPGDARLVCFPLNTLTGFGFRLTGKNGKPEVLWQQTYANAYWQGFGPQMVLADMDNDNTPEVVIAGKPGYAGVIDLETGALRYEARYQVTEGPDIGRPYGLLTAEDLDGDGFRDIVVASCQVEEYVAVLRNRQGKGLEHIWSQFIEKDYPDDQKELRPNIASVADIDGDGKRELALGLFNATGDGKWHTVVFDAFGGFQARKIDLPGRYFWGCYDLTGDGVAEIITSAETARRTAPASLLVAVDGRTGRDIASVPAARLTFWNGALENHTGFLALRNTPVFLKGKGVASGLLVRRKGGAGQEELWRITGGKSVFAPLRAAAGARATALSSPTPSLEGIDLGFRGTSGRGGPDATNPLVSLASGKRELVVELSDGSVVGGEPEWTKPGRFRRFWTLPGGLPRIWRTSTGERIVCTADESRDLLYLAKPTLGKRDNAEPIRVRLPYPLHLNAYTKSGATLLPFGDETLHLFVGLQTGVHTLACALFDANGKELWLNPKVGPYPRTAAAARLEPNAPYTLIVNDHYNKMLFSLDGRPQLDLPYGSYRNKIMVNSPYALPIVGPYGPQGKTRLFFTPGLDTVQALDANGNILVNRYFNTYEFEYCGSSVATMRSGLWDLGMINHDGVFHCVDLQTGQSRWTLGLGAKSYIFNVSTADIDGDGRDNFLVGLPNGELLALDEQEGKGVILWRMTFDAGVRDAFAADVDGDGYAEVIAETEDGRVRVLASQERTQERRP